MRTCVWIPSSIESATRELESTFDQPLDVLPKLEFIRAWCALSYLNPSLHPDDFDVPGSGWLENFKRYAVEAWRREQAGELVDEEMYPSDAAWAGLYDQMHTHCEQETARRLELAAQYGWR